MRKPFLPGSLRIAPLVVAAALVGCCITTALADDAKKPPSKRLEITWAKNYLTIRGDHLVGGEISINYLEAYCRPGSTDRDWGKTVIGHQTELLCATKDRRVIKLRDVLKDGVVVNHTITAGPDEVDFRLVAHNPTKKVSLADWAQPCIRVHKFTGCDPKDAHKLYPPYIRQSFIFLDNKLTRLPTRPWATKARYTPGQVYCPKDVDRDDVNPRPLSKLVPSNGLMGCFSADGKQVMAIAWHPYQELFQGVITCIHSDFRIGGLEPGQTKKMRGKLYLMNADSAKLVKRYVREFPEHVKK